MLHYAKDQIDRDALRRHLQALEMVKAYKACGVILVDHLGLSQNELGYLLSDSDRRYGKRSLDIVLFRGNMGHYNKLGGFSGWMHKAESTVIKLSHFAKFAPINPSHAWGWLWHEIKRNL